MTAQELITQCLIKLHGDDALAVNLPKGLTKTQKAKMIADLTAAKPEIIAILKAEAQAKEDAYQAKENAIAGIEGLAELKKAINAEYAYYREFNRRMEDEALSSFAPAPPKVKAADLKAKYPRAAAYLKAENWTMAGHYAKGAAGQKAVSRILSGEDYIKVIADMEAEWSDYCNEHIWD